VCGGLATFNFNYDETVHVGLIFVDALVNRLGDAILILSEGDGGVRARDDLYLEYRDESEEPDGNFSLFNSVTCRSHVDGFFPSVILIERRNEVLWKIDFEEIQ
jgi:hypothetical protein